MIQLPAFIGYYRLQYLALLFSFFTAGMLLVNKEAVTVSDFLICFLYALAITVNSFITDRILLPLLLYKRKTGLFLLGIVALLTATAFATMPLVYAVKGIYFMATSQQGFTGNWMLSYFVPFALALVTTTIIKISLDQGATRRQLQSLQKENAETELNFLKAQINPHFLFNSLNTVYFQIDKTNTMARNTLLQFTNMLQYQLYECGGDTTPIEKEVQYIENYIALQKQRKDDQYNISFHKTDDIRGFSFVPLVFICFIENAFKHVSHHAHKENVIAIKMYMKEQSLVFDCYNTTGAVEEKEAVQYGGIGLKNARRRLQLLYPNRHTLHIDRQSGSFCVLLQVTID
jgi:two-component system, LytTR family, sensor kinase